MSTSRRQRGLTLIEMIIFMVVVSIGVIGILQVMSISAVNSVDPQRRKQALAIAESMMEEIQLAKFNVCDIASANIGEVTDATNCALPDGVGREPTNNVRPYDHVNDYVPAFGAVQNYNADAAGNAFPAGYVASVTIVPDAGLGPAGAVIAPADGTPANMNVLRITVSVSYGNDRVVLDGYRTRYAPAI